MNFRFASRSIRIRISDDEFSQLRSSKTLSLEVALPGHHIFKARVSIAADSDWHFESDPTGMWISVPRAEIDALADGLPSKEGIEHSFETFKENLLISLEVDVKKRT